MVQSLIVISCIVLQKTATYCLSVPVFVHFSFSPMKISVADLSVPIGASVFKFCVHLQVGKCIVSMKIKMLKLILPSFSIFLSVTPI